MPEELDDKKNKPGADDQAGAGDKKPEDEKGQEGGDKGEPQDQGGEEETVTIKKSELDKIKSDRDNYRTAAINKAADKMDLDKGGDDKGGKGDKGGGTDGIDEAKATEIAKSQASEQFGQIAQSNERRAKRMFLQKNPEYADAALQEEMLTHFTGKRGKASAEDIMEDLQEAVLLHKHATGKLDEYIKSLNEKARNEGFLRGQMMGAAGSPGAGDKDEGKQKPGLSQKGREMATAMHTDPEKAAKVDPGKESDREIANP